MRHVVEDSSIKVEDSSVNVIFVDARGQKELSVSRTADAVYVPAKTRPKSKTEISIVRHPVKEFNCNCTN
jgi:hypothetical protein